MRTHSFPEARRLGIMINATANRSPTTMTALRLRQISRFSRAPFPRRSLSHCASSGRRRVFIKKAIPPPSRNGKKQRSDSSDNADYTAEVHQRPRKQDKQRQRAKDMAKVASVEPECLRLCGSIALLLLMLALCFLFHFFFSVLLPAASLEKLNCLNHGNHQHGQAQRDAVFGSAHRREAKGVGQERNLQNGGCEDKRTDHCRP